MIELSAMLPSRHTAERRKGFTILELLATVAIIGLLASLLLPTLIGSKERTRRVACKNNMRQFHLAAFMYAGDHNEILPSAIRDSLDEHLSWISSMTWTNLRAYGSEKFFDCPNYPTPFNQGGGVYNPGYGFVIGYHYMAGLHDWGDWRSPHRTTDDPNLLLLTDGNQWSPLFRWSRFAHGNTGPRMYGTPFNDNNISVRPQDSGVSGGHRAQLNGAVEWIPRARMEEHIASIWGTAYMAAW
jgi:prepilin-type N-terminal cleavage/methylation domain-containing protein